MLQRIKVCKMMCCKGLLLACTKYSTMYHKSIQSCLYKLLHVAKLELASSNTCIGSSNIWGHTCLATLGKSHVAEVHVLLGNHQADHDCGCKVSNEAYMQRLGA